MGFLGQIIGVKVHGAESTHEKVTQLIKDGKTILKILEQEVVLEKKVVNAENERNAEEVIKLQKEELLLISKAFAEIKHLLVEIFALSDEQKNEIDRFIIESKKLQSEGMVQGEERKIQDLLNQKKAELSEIFAATRGTAGMMR